MMENENYTQSIGDMPVSGARDMSLSASSSADAHKAVVEMNDDPEVIVVAEGTTEIAVGEYKERVNLKEVRLPKSLTKIGKRAFYGCQNLTTVVFGGNEVEIEDEAFANCRALRKIDLPQSLEVIGYGAIENFEIGGGISLKNLKSLGSRNFNISSSLRFEVGPKLENIGMSSFNCVTKITVDAANKNFELKDGMLLDKAGKRLLFCEKDKVGIISVPSSVETIDDYAFYNCRKMTEVVLTSKLTAIPSYAFSGCEALTTCTIPEGVTKIGRFAFYRCKSLSQVTIPGTVTSIESYAFGSCALIKEAYVPEGCETRGAFEKTVSVVVVSPSQMPQAPAPSAAVTGPSVSSIPGSAAASGYSVSSIPGSAATSGYSVSSVRPGSAAAGGYSVSSVRPGSAAAGGYSVSSIPGSAATGGYSVSSIPGSAAASSSSSVSSIPSDIAEKRRGELYNQRMEAKRAEQQRVKEERQSAQEQLNQRMRDEFYEKKEALMQKVQFVKEELKKTSGVNVLKKNKLNNQLYECTIQAIDLNGKYGAYIDDSEKIEIDD